MTLAASVIGSGCAGGRPWHCCAHWPAVRPPPLPRSQRGPASADTETAEEADEIGRQTVLDLRPRDGGGLDLAPGSDSAMPATETQRTRRRLLDMAREAEELHGDRDEKLQKAIR